MKIKRRRRRRSLFPAISKKLEALAEAYTEKVKLEAEKKAALEASTRVEALRKKKRDVQAIIDDLDVKMKELSYKADIEAAEKKKADKLECLETLKIKLIEIRNELEGAEMLCDIMGNGGLKSYIFDSVTPELNRIVSDYMMVLNPDIDVEISTVSKLKSKDEFREKFSIKVSNKTGSSSYDGNSSGEKQLINLSIALGFNSLCRAISEGSVNVLWLDEPLESLDEGSSERAIELIQKFIAEVPNVFLVSHNPAVRDLIADKIVIEKRGGVAKLVA